MAAPVQNNCACLTARHLVREVTDCLAEIPDPRPNHCQNGIPFGNFPKCGYAMFQMKMPSMLRFDQERQDPVQAHNLETLFDVINGRVPCDTYLREVLDPISPHYFQRPYKRLFNRFQRSGRLQHFEFRIDRLKNHYLLAVDGTQTFFSGKLHCDDCCIKNEGKPSEAYYHQLMGGCIVHPDQKVVIPLAPEAIVYQDGHWFRFVNDVSLNKSEPVESVNVLDFVETDKKGKRHTWSWVTDIHLSEKTIESLMKGGRCRWHIENQTFNTLKQQDYHLEHNYGHGKQHLATNLAYLAVLAFLVDQLQQLGSPEFKRALKERAKGTRTHLWELMKGYFQSWLIKTWEGLFDAITNRAVAGVVPYDTS